MARYKPPTRAQAEAARLRDDLKRYLKRTAASKRAAAHAVEMGSRPMRELSYRQWLIGQALAGCSGMQATGSYAPYASHDELAAEAIARADAVLARQARGATDPPPKYRPGSTVPIP